MIILKVTKKQGFPYSLKDTFCANPQGGGEIDPAVVLGLQIMNNGEINIYVKDTNSGLYVNYNSYEPWHTKTAWIRALYDRAHKICSNVNLFQKQVACIKKIMSWNGYRQ